MAGISNPLSMPGGWNKETPKEEQSNPVDNLHIPRSAAGVVSETGEVLDHSGKAIGKITDSENPGELVGNTVNETGEIVSSTGNVLGKALPLGDEENQNSEYTHQGGRSFGSGFKNVANTFGSVTRSIGFGRGKSASSQSQPPESAVNDDSTEKQDTPPVLNGVDNDTPLKLEDHDPCATEQAPKEDKNTPKDFETQDVQENIHTAKSEIQPDDSISKVGTEDLKAKSEVQDIPDIQEETSGVQKEIPKGQDETISEAQKDIPESQKAVSDVQKGATDVGKDVSDVQKDLPEDQKDVLDPQKSEAGVQEGVSDIQKAPSTIQKDIPEPEVSTSQAPASEVPKSEAPGTEIIGSEAPQTDLPADEATEEKQEEQPEGEQEPSIDYSILKGTLVNKAGNLVNDKGDVIGRVVEGDVKKLLGKRCDENGEIWNNAGKVVGKGEPLPDAEREDLKEFAPFENFPGATVEADGSVVFEGRRIGTVVEGDPKRLKGSKVDEDGDILDRRGNVVGKAEAWDEPEPEPEPELEQIDRSILAGKRVNKAGNVVGSNGEIYGRVIEGHIGSLVGRMCDKDGNVRSESGDIIGKAELVPEGEREGYKDGPFAELQGCTVSKDGKVVTPSGDVVGRLISGDPKILYGRAVDEDGDILDRNGNSIGKAERWEEPEIEKKKNPLSGRKVNREGNVVDEEGNIVGKLTSGDLSICSGKEVDDDGDVVNSKGQTIGHVNLLEEIPEPEPEPESEPEPEPEESEEEKQKRLEAEKDRKLAGQLSACIEQSLDRIRPLCKLITDKIDRAERTPKEELDEEDLVKQVKPLIEEGGRILSETNGMIRGLDPDGRIQRNAKQKSGTREGSPEEFHLAEVLKELTGTITTCIDGAKSKIADMPHAKKELNPLWGLLAEPLGQILAAVGLLLSGVLGIVGRLLSGLGLGGILDGLLGTLGLNRVLEGLGLGDVVGALTGKKKK